MGGGGFEKGGGSFRLVGWAIRPERSGMSFAKVTVDAIRAMKGGKRIPALTTYDYPMTRLLDETGVPLLLVGDSLGMVVLGCQPRNGGVVTA